MKKYICLLLTIIATFLTLSISGCGNKTEDKADVIEINYWKAGLGDEFFKAIVAEFEKEHPEYTIDPHYKEDFSDVNTKVPLGAKYNTVDIYFGPSPDVALYKYIEPINSILDEVNKGETKKVGEKIDEYLLLNAKFSDGNYYSLPYGGGICGIVYNVELMEEVLSSSHLKMPNTTDELRDVVLAIQSKYGQTHKPFIHFKGGYWEYVMDVWQAQYDGIEDYNYFYRLGARENTIGTKDETPNKEVLLRDDGRYETLKVLEQLVSSSTVVSGSNSSIHTDAQTKFLAGQAVMMCNGAWLVNEMKSVNAAYTDFRVMRTPVISSIKNKCTTIYDDEELSALIDAIDEGSSALEGEGYEVNQEDFNRVKEARSLIWQVFSEHGVYVPNYSVAKEGAKEFIKFYYSDKAQKIFNDKVHIVLPFSYDKEENEPDTSSWNNFEKDMLNYANSLTMLGVAIGKRSSLFTIGGLVNYPVIENNNFIISVMSRGDDPKGATYIWKEMKSLYEKNWDIYLSNARLK